MAPPEDLEEWLTEATVDMVVWQGERLLQIPERDDR
jgi:hypothetical protein